MTPTQARMARAALGWTGREAEEKTGAGRASISRYESNIAIRPDTVKQLCIGYEDHGVRFFHTHQGRVVEGVIPPL